MTKQTTTQKNTRTQYSQSYRDDALALAERIGFSKAATQLGILESQLYYWRNKHRLQLKWSTKIGHSFRVLPEQPFRFIRCQTAVVLMGT